MSDKVQPQSEKPADKRLSTAAMACVIAMAILGMAGGWLILLGGGFHHQLAKYSSKTLFVSGFPALLMAAFQFMLAGVAITAIMKELHCSMATIAIILAVVFAPAIIFATAGFQAT